jgi:uncharacterized membrane protein YbhN (UPF0104 family)
MKIAPHRTRIAVAVLALAALAVLAGLAWRSRKGFDWIIFWSTLRAMDARWLAASIFFSYGTYFVRAFRWAVLLRPLRPHPRFWPLFSATVIGFTAVTVLGRAGEFVRPWLIASREDVPVASQVAAWVVERLYDLLIALAVFGFALSRVSGAGFSLGPALSWALETGGLMIGLLSAFGLGVLLAMKYRSEHIQRWILRLMSFLSEHHFNRVERVVIAFLDGVSSTKSQSAMVWMITYTLVEWLLIAACYACVLNAFGGSVRMTLIQIMILMGFVSFGSIVQLPGIGGGMQVTALLVLTEIFSVPIEVATGLAIILWVMVFLTITPLGVGLALHEGLSWAKLREAGAAQDRAETGLRK